MLPPKRIFTNNSSSPLYLQPTWECALSLIGIKATSHAIIKFHRETEETFINLHLQREPETTTPPKPGDVGETFLEVYSPENNIDIVSREVVQLDPDVWTYFSVFRKDRVFAVFRAGHQLPLLVFVVSPEDEAFVSDLKLVRVWSKDDAEWDLRGDGYRGENNARKPMDPAIRKELKEMREGLTSRLGVAAVLRKYGWRPDKNDPRLMKYPVLRDTMATLRPLKMLLVYYGRVRNANDSWHDPDKVTRFMTKKDISSVLN